MTSQPRPADTRPVWLTREQRDHCANFLVHQGTTHLAEIAMAWDAAPSDAAGDIEVAIFAYDFPLSKRPWTAQEREEYAARAALVLRALGYPHTEQA